MGQMYVAIQSQSKDPILKEDQMIVEKMIKEITEGISRPINLYWAKWEVKQYSYRWGLVYRFYPNYDLTNDYEERMALLFQDMGYQTPKHLKEYHYLRNVEDGTN